MGCDFSQNAELLEQERLAREKEKLEYDENLKSLEQKKYEQINLLRFKIEVLVQMLGIEETKQETLNKRLEALKWAMLTQGWSERSMDSMIATLHTPSDNNEQLRLLSSLDLTSSITSFSEVVKNSRDEFIRSFADQEGRVFPVLNRNDFVKKVIHSSGNRISEMDAQILSIRFSDGTMVSVPEFLDFFLSTPELRRAKAATAAVRSSINMLQLEDSKENETKDSEIEESKNTFRSKSSHKMVTLDRAIYKMTRIWKFIAPQLREKFSEVTEGRKIIDLDAFQVILKELCSKETIAASLPDTEKSSNLGLLSHDIELLSDRFEVAEKIDWHIVLAFFDERMTEKPNRCYSKSPFLLSTEWAALKKDAKVELDDAVDETGLGVDKDKEIKSGPSVAKSTDMVGVEALLEGGKSDGLEPPTQALSPDRPKSKLSKRLDKPRLSSSSLQSKPSETSEAVVLKAYCENPDQFEQNVKNVAELPKIRGKFTPSLLREKLRELCPDCTEREAMETCNKVDFKDGFCSAQDIIVTLRAMKLAKEGTSPDASPPTAEQPQSASPEVKKEESVLTSVPEEKKGEAPVAAAVPDPNAADAIAHVDEKNKKEDLKVVPLKSTPEGADFEKMMKTYSDNPSAFAKAFTQDELPPWMAEHVPSLKEDAVKAFLASAPITDNLVDGKIPCDLFVEKLREELVKLVGPDGGPPVAVPPSTAQAAAPPPADDFGGFFWCCSGPASDVHDPNAAPGVVPATPTPAVADAPAEAKKDGDVTAGGGDAEDHKDSEKGSVRDEKGNEDKDTRAHVQPPPSARKLDDILNQEGSEQDEIEIAMNDAKPVRTPVGSRSSSARLSTGGVGQQGSSASKPPSSSASAFTAPKVPRKQHSRGTIGGDMMDEVVE